MCTVTFIARQRGYRLGMNRDEQRTRPTSLPPKEKQLHGQTLLCPTEPSGGTWIAVNQHGVTFALINWYSIPTRVTGQVLSRGEVVLSTGTTRSPNSAAAALAELPLTRMNPFRLIGVFPARREIVEWRWDLQRLVHQPQPWKTQQWISSGWDEPTTQSVRSKIFQHALRQASAQRPDWLRRLHRSHFPKVGPFSTCMHRDDATTVSYTEVAVSPHQAAMRHHLGCPCQPHPPSIHHLALARTAGD